MDVFSSTDKTVFVYISTFSICQSWDVAELGCMWCISQLRMKRFNPFETKKSQFTKFCARILLKLCIVLTTTDKQNLCFLFNCQCNTHTHWFLVYIYTLPGVHGNSQCWYCSRYLITASVMLQNATGTFII